MLDIPFDQFAKYYKIDEMSESDENDFEDDGRTLRSSESLPRTLILDDN